MKKHFIAAALFAAVGAGAAVWTVTQKTKIPIEQEYVLSPSEEGMECKSDAAMTACFTTFGGKLDGLDYNKLAFVKDEKGRAIYVVGSFKRSQYEDAFDSFTGRHGDPDDRLGDIGDRRSIWFLKNGLAVMRERAAKAGEGSAAFSLFCFDGGDDRVTEEMGSNCKKMFKPAAI